MTKIAVIVGRFQVDELTKGHVELLEHALANYNDVFVFTGQAIAPNRKNVLPNSTVVAMVRDECALLNLLASRNTAYFVSTIKDVNNPPVWSANLDNMIGGVCRMRGYDNAEITLIGGRDSYIDEANPYHYVGIHKNIEIFSPEYLSESVSATETREQIQKEDPLNDRMYRRGMIKARLSMYPIAYQTVDVLIRYLDKNTGDVYFLFGKKPNRPKLVFVGGFSDPTSNSLEEDAIREAFEETDLIVSNARYVLSMKINDARYRGTEDCIKTALFIVDSESKDFKIKDENDIGNLEWVKLEDVTVDMMSDIHGPLMAEVINRNLLK